MPPLREREEDIIGLAKYFVELYARKYGRLGLELSRNDRGMLMRYAWPGNVRELQNVIERAVILTKGKELQIPLFPTGPQTSAKAIFDDLLSLDELQRRYIRHVFDYVKGRVGGTRRRCRYPVHEAHVTILPHEGSWHEKIIPTLW